MRRLDGITNSVDMSLGNGSEVKASASNAGDLGLIPGSGRFPGEGNGYPLTPVFLPREFHGQRILEVLQSKGSQRVRHD